MGSKTYVAHISADGERFETVKQHLNEVAQMAKVFAVPFGGEESAFAIGLLHDIGKYSQEFQNRILYGAGRVDHSTAGAVELANNISVILSYCVAGHHGGLPDGGVPGDRDKTLIGRLSKAKRGCLPNYDAFHNEIAIPSVSGLPFNFDKSRTDKEYIERANYSVSFLIRMLFSCLVDADFLCTECFMSGEKRPRPSYMSLLDLRELLENKLTSFYPPVNAINKIRCGVLDDCKCAAELPPGIFSLTVPTGGGKTYALMRFALWHATNEGHKFQRIICAEPYTSIIEQSAQVYRDVFGTNQVLEHHSNYDFDSEELGSEKYRDTMRLASENWDVPIVVTTNVQLFESLYAHKTSRCRKLHNIVRSIIVLDEAQMIPTNYLGPCVRALSELVKNYGCTVVLCTATQPALNGYFDREGLEVREIARDTERLANELRRVEYWGLGHVSDEKLCNELVREHQALCIVNSRRQARKLYELVNEAVPHSADTHNGVFHLSTLMHPVHRSKTIKTIRERLNLGLSCVVIATCLVEAGVDLDFSTVYRAVAGVDSMIQAAGRCNREMRHPASESKVRLFVPETQYKLPSDVVQRTSVSCGILPGVFEVGKIQGLDSTETIRSFFSRLYEVKDIDCKNVVDRFSALRAGRFPAFPFARVGEEFKLIEDGAYDIIIPDETNVGEVQALREGHATRVDMRRLSMHGVRVFRTDRDALFRAGVIEAISEDVFILNDSNCYRDDIGLDINAETGKALYL